MSSFGQNLRFDSIYTTQLQQIGVEVFYGDEYHGSFCNWIEQNGFYLDVVLLSRPQVATEFLNDIRRHSTAKVLYYGHDLHHLRIKSQLKLDPKNKNLKKEFLKFEIMEKELFPKMDAIYYPSNAEVNFVKDYLDELQSNAVTKCLPVYGFNDFEFLPCGDPNERCNLLFVAGFAHKPNEDAAIWFVMNVFPIILKSIPNIKLFLVGSNPTPKVLELSRENVVVTGYVSDQTLQDFYRSSRVAVAPLRFGGGMKGKVVEAMRFGLPIVTTTYGAQGLEDVTHGIFVSDDPEIQAENIVMLTEKDDIWISSSQQIQLYAKKHFSVEAMWDTLKDQFEVN